MLIANWLQEWGIGPIEIFKGLITEAWKEIADHNPVMRYMVFKPGPKGRAWQNMAGSGAVKQTQLGFQSM